MKTLKTLLLITQTKKEAHRFYAVLMQLGVKSCELHGDVTQALRYLALQRFRDNEVDVMVNSSLTRFLLANLIVWFLNSCIALFKMYTPNISFPFSFYDRFVLT